MREKRIGMGRSMHYGSRRKKNNKKRRYNPVRIKKNRKNVLLKYSMLYAKSYKCTMNVYNKTWQNKKKRINTCNKSCVLM